MSRPRDRDVRPTGGGRRWRIAGWGTVAFAVACMAATPVVESALQAQGASLGAAESMLGMVVWLGSWIGFPIVGAIVVHRQPHNRIGRVLVALGAASYVGFALSAAGMLNDVSGGPRWLTAAASLLAPFVYTWLLLLVPMLLARFPSGDIVNPVLARLRPVALGVVIVVTFARALRPGPMDDVALVNPLGLPVPRPLMTAVLVAGTLALVGFGLVALGDLLLRWRRSRGVERAQMRWFMTAGMLFPILWALGVVGTELTARRGLGDTLILAAFFLGFVGMASAIGVAVLRYRLYEIDRLVSRTLGYGVLTALLLVVYAASVVALRRVFAPLSGDSDLAVAGSTLVVAALFGPVGRRVQTAVDRRFNRARFDASRAAAAFSQRLRDEVNLHAVAEELRQTVAATIQPATAAVWLLDREDQP